MTGSDFSVHEGQDLWIFGYGSLTWKVNFPFRRKVAGYIKGYTRRFYQGSCDHRGVPGKPGRVATLLEAPKGVVWGIAYKVEAAEVPNVLTYLDIREKDGYKACYTTFHPRDSQEPALQTMLYVATPENEFYLGPASLPDIAKQVLYSEGPSGKNSEYVLQLAAAIREISGCNKCDEHLNELETLVKEGLSKEDLSKNGQIISKYA